MLSEHTHKSYPMPNRLPAVHNLLSSRPWPEILSYIWKQWNGKKNFQMIENGFHCSLSDVKSFLTVNYPISNRLLLISYKQKLKSHTSRPLTWSCYQVHPPTYASYFASYLNRPSERVVAAYPFQHARFVFVESLPPALFEGYSTQQWTHPLDSHPLWIDCLGRRFPCDRLDFEPLAALHHLYYVV